MKNAACEAGGKIGAKIERAIFLDAAREIDAWIFFGSSEFDVRVGFVVAKNDIELGAILLDEIVFERKSFALVAHEDGFDVGDFTGERTGLGVDPAGLEKIGTHAAAQGTRLADIEHGAGGVFEEVDAGTFWKERGYFSGFHGNSARKFLLLRNLHHTRIVTGDSRQRAGQMPGERLASRGLHEKTHANCALCNAACFPGARRSAAWRGAGTAAKSGRQASGSDG